MQDREGILIKIQLQICYRTEEALDGSWISLVSSLSSAALSQPEAWEQIPAPLTLEGGPSQSSHRMTLELPFWRKWSLALRTLQIIFLRQEAGPDLRRKPF